DRRIPGQQQIVRKRRRRAFRRRCGASHKVGDERSFLVKLYTSPNSPFGARVTIAARAKGVTLDHVGLPAGGLRSPEYLALNPIAKIPVLETEGGTVIPESRAILDYLE